MGTISEIQRPGPARVLVAEAGALVSAMVADELTRAGYLVQRVHDGSAAHDIAVGADPPDLLITGGQLTGLTGIELCAALRAAGSVLPIIFLTSDGDQLTPALDAGADDFVRKPPAPHELLARVRSALRAGELTLQLARERDRYAALMGALQDGVLVFDATGRIVDANPRIGQIVGRPHGQLIGLSPPFPFWPAELWPEYERSFRDALARAGRTEADRIYAVARRRVDVIVSLAPVGEGPSPALFVSTVKDVTSRRTAERALRRSEARHRALADEQASLGRVASTVASSATPENVFDLVAKEVADLLGADAGGVTRYEGGTAVLVGAWSTSPDLRLPTGSRLPLVAGGATARVRHEGVAVRIDDYDHQSDHWAVRLGSAHMSAVAAPVRVAGEVWGNVGVVSARRAAFPPGTEHRLQEFAELVGVAVTGAHARSELSRQALTDPLTGLVNRRGFAECLDAEVEAASAGDGDGLALILIDIDHFKRVNDQHGHAVGDAVLRELAARLDSLRREGDLVARIGGEEFAVLLPEADDEAARTVAERLRLAAADRPFATVGRRTISLGVAVWEPGDDSDRLLRRADERLYRAKGAGRDRVVADDPVAV